MKRIIIDIETDAEDELIISHINDFIKDNFQKIETAKVSLEGSPATVQGVSVEKYAHQEELNEKKEKPSFEHSLSRAEIHKFGELVLRDISSSYVDLTISPDNIWMIDEDMELFKKLCSLVVRLQDGKRLVDNGRL